MNNNLECLYDNGDCDQCQETLMSDGKCHAVNNHEICDFDGGDCLNLPDECVEGIGNGYCDIFTNTKECHYDGGECCDSRIPQPEIFVMIWCPDCGYGCIDPSKF